MGSFDGAEMSESVGIYVLYILSTKYFRNRSGIYRNDGLACFKNVSGLKADWMRKNFINIFRKEFQLCIVCETNFEIMNFLDVTLDLRTGKHRPDNKPGNIRIST